MLRYLGIAGVAAALPLDAVTGAIKLKAEEEPLNLRASEEPLIDSYDVRGDPLGSIIDYPAYTLENFPVRYQLVKVEKPYRKFSIKKGTPVFWKDKDKFIATPTLQSIDKLAGIFLGDYAISRDRYWIQIASHVGRGPEHRAGLELAKRNFERKVKDHG